MSAAFCYSSRDVTRLDLRHIYSGQSSRNYRTAPPLEHEGINYLDRIHEDMRRRHVSKYPGKCFEYNRQYGAVVPRAPAFRRFSRTEVKSVVDRLTKPDEYYIRKQRYVSFSAPPIRNVQSIPEYTSTPQKRRKPLTKEDINEMVNRLFETRRARKAAQAERENGEMKSEEKTQPEK